MKGGAVNEMAEIREAFQAGADGKERIWARLESREVSTDGEIRMGGTAAVFGARAKVRLRDGRVVAEEVADSAFNNTLKRGDIFLLWQHNPAEPMARTGAGSLGLSVRTGGKLPGLDWQAQNMPLTQRVRDAAALLDSGVIDKMSFGFTVPKGGDSIEPQDDGTLLRRIHDLRLAEISLVTWPAYQETSASLRADAFGVLCRSLGIDEDDVLTRMSHSDMLDLDTLKVSAASQQAEPGAVTTSEDAARAVPTAPAGIHPSDSPALKRMLRLVASPGDLPKELLRGVLPAPEAG